MKNVYLNFFIRFNFLVFILFLNVGAALADELGFELFYKMKYAYENVEYYSDTGVVRTQRSRGGIYNEFEDTLFFKTEFFSNNNLSFQWGYTQDDLDAAKNLIYRDNGLIKKVRRGVESSVGNMNSLLVSLSGVTRSVSYLIPRYLLSDVSSVNKSSIKNIDIEKAPKKDNRYAHKLKITFKHGRIDYVWLNEQFFITKLRYSLTRKDGVVVNDEIIIRPITEKAEKK